MAKVIAVLFLIATTCVAVADPVVIITQPVVVPPGGSIVQRPLGSDDKCSAQYNPCAYLGN